jgi:hypothetical protein
LFNLDAFEGFDGLLCAIWETFDVARALSYETSKFSLHEAEDSLVDIGGGLLCRFSILGDIGDRWTRESGGYWSVSEGSILRSRRGDILGIVDGEMG